MKWFHAGFTVGLILFVVALTAVHVAIAAAFRIH